MKEKKARVEDALHSTRAAVEEGIVPGGGVALIRAKNAIQKTKGDNADQEAGINIVLRAIEDPLRQIVSNAGIESSVVVNNVAEGKGNYGFNAANETYGDRWRHYPHTLGLLHLDFGCQGYMTFIILGRERILLLRILNILKIF